VGKIIFKGKCIDNQDPLKLGRIRAVSLTENERNKLNAFRSEESGEKIYEKWSNKDPFVFHPLLPFFNNSSPKEGELIKIFYSDTESTNQAEKYYVSGVFSSPTTSNFEEYESSLSNFDMGVRYKRYKNLLNKDGELVNSDLEGIYGKPEDNKVYGRGSSDMIIKDNEVIIRAGKYKPFENKELPKANNKRAYIHLTEYNNKTSFGKPSINFKFKSQHTNTKKLIQYDILNIENNNDNFQGRIYIYNLRPDTKNMTDNISPNSNFEGLKSLQLQINVNNSRLDTFVNVVNDTIKFIQNNELNRLTIKYNNVELIGQENVDIGNTFPIYFRSSRSLYDKYKDLGNLSSVATQGNIKFLYNAVGVNKDDKGFGLIYSKKENRVPFKPVRYDIIPKKTENLNNTLLNMGADKLYLLSHESQKPGRGKINFDKTLYGFDESKVSEELEPKTSSMVRGEELIELLDIMVRFLISHVHPYHGLPPNPKSLEGTTTNELLSELLNASQKVLNNKIRIN